jgi:hypothetical protein
VSDSPGPEAAAGPAGEEDAVSAQPSEDNAQEGGTADSIDSAESTESDARKSKKTSAAESIRDETSIKVPLPEPMAEPGGSADSAADGDGAGSTSSSSDVGSSSVVRDSTRPALHTPGDDPGPSSGSASGSPYGSYPTTGPQFSTAPPPDVSRQDRLAGLAQAAKSVKGKAARTGGRAAGRGKAPRRANLQVSRLEPWSVMKFSFVMSLVCFVVVLVAVTVLYMILSGLGVFDAISSTVNDLTQEQGTGQGGLDAASWFSFSRVFGYTVLIGAVNVLLITALSTVGAVIYNMAADLVGGVEVTLKEAE